MSKKWLPCTVDITLLIYWSDLIKGVFISESLPPDKTLTTGQSNNNFSKGSFYTAHYCDLFFYASEWMFRKISQSLKTGAVCFLFLLHTAHTIHKTIGSHSHTHTAVLLLFRWDWQMGEVILADLVSAF